MREKAKIGICLPYYIRPLQICLGTQCKSENTPAPSIILLCFPSCLLVFITFIAVPLQALVIYSLPLFPYSICICTPISLPYFIKSCEALSSVQISGVRQYPPKVEWQAYSNNNNTYAADWISCCT